MQKLTVKYKVRQADGSHKVFFKSYATMKEITQGNAIIYRKYGKQNVTATII